MAWIGTPGQLIEFKCPSALEITPTDGRRVFTSSTGAVSVTHPLGRHIPRVWQVEVDAARPQDVANLLALSLGDFGVGPFLWVPPGAESTNLLTPQDSLCRGVAAARGDSAPAGAMLTTEGWAGRSLSPGGPGIVLGRAPVLPGVPVSGRAWALGATVAVALRFYTSTGTPLAPTTGATVNAGTGAWAAVSSAAAPAGAGWVDLEALNATQVARPAITWTREPRTWTPGAGADAVSVQPIPATVLRATGRVCEETITRHAFTVQEITP